MSNRTPLMAGNWKMNLNHLEAIALVQKIAFSLDQVDFDAVEVAVRLMRRSGWLRCEPLGVTRPGKCRMERLSRFPTGTRPSARASPAIY